MSDRFRENPQDMELAIALRRQGASYTDIRRQVGWFHISESTLSRRLKDIKRGTG
jgi:DNA-binding HxlR family transcriptional regulator